MAVGRFPSGEVRGVLWGATIENLADRARHVGPKQIQVKAPTSPQVMRMLGDELVGEVDQAGRRLYSVDDAVSFEVLVGSTVDGLVRHRFVVRDEVQVSDGEVSFTAVGWVGGLTSDRVIGAPERYNLLRLNPSFEHGDLRGWALVAVDGGGVHRVHGVAGVTELSAGSATARIVAGGVDGEWAAEVTGTPGFAWLEARKAYSQPERPWGRQRIAGTAYGRLPGGGLDLDDYGLVTIAVGQGGVLVWPSARYGDPEAGVVTSDLERGTWSKDPVVGVGKLPAPPYTCDVILRLHAVHETEPVAFDDGQIIRRENTSTETSKDLTRHVEPLMRHAQEPGRPGYKSPWGISTVVGEPVGISEVGTWWHPDGQSLNEALEALAGRGMDIFDLAGPGRRIMASKRRGSVRTDVEIHPWDVLGQVRWRVDPGAQQTSIRAVSAAGSIWGGADEGATDTSRSGGQVIDVILNGPVGMTPKQLRAWVLDKLAGVSVLQATSTLLLPWRLGMRLEVGDTVRVGMVDGAAAKLDWFQVTEWVPAPLRRFVAVTVGTDPELGGS